MDAKIDYLLVLNNTLTKSTNKLTEMSSVCDSNIVVTSALAKVAFSQWYAGFGSYQDHNLHLSSTPTSVTRSSRLEISYNASIRTMEMSKCYEIAVIEPILQHPSLLTGGPI